MVVIAVTTTHHAIFRLELIKYPFQVLEKLEVLV